MTIKIAYQKAALVTDQLDNQLQQAIKGVPLAQLFLTEILSAIKNKQKFQAVNLWSYALKLYVKRQIFNRQLPKKHWPIIVFITSNSHVKINLPVVDALREKGVDVLFVTTKEKVFQSLHKKGYTVYFILGIKPWGRLKGTLNNTQENSDLIIGYEVIRKNYPKTIYLEKQFSKILKIYRPGYILIGNDNLHEGRLLSIIATQQQIPTGSIQHGSLNTSYPVHGRSLVNEYFVFGAKAKDALVKMGKPAKEIKVSGWPLKSYDRRESQAKENITNKRLILVCLSGPGHSTSHDHHRVIVEAICDSFSLNSYEVLFKLHPKDRKENYLPALQEEGTKVWDNSDLKQQSLDLNDLIMQAEWILTGASTVALEALLQKKKVITIDLMNEYPNIDFIEDGLTIHVTTAAELRAIAFGGAGVETRPKADFQMAVEHYYYRHFDTNYDPAEAISTSIMNRIN